MQSWTYTNMKRRHPECPAPLVENLPQARPASIRPHLHRNASPGSTPNDASLGASTETRFGLFHSTLLVPVLGTRNAIKSFLKSPILKIACFIHGEPRSRVSSKLQDSHGSFPARRSQEKRSPEFVHSSASGVRVAYKPSGSNPIGCLTLPLFGEFGNLLRKSIIQFSTGRTNNRIS